MQLMDMLREAGYPEGEMFHHESDLYVFVNTLTANVIGRWLDERGYSDKRMVDVFRDKKTGRLMYDLPFQYTPYWEEKFAS